MEKQLGSEYSPDARERFLKDNCHEVEKLNYMKRFSTEELDLRKEELANASIEANDIEEEKKIVVDGFKERLKPLNEIKRDLLTQLKQRAVLVNEVCFKFVDHEANEVGYYNKEGELIQQRPIHPEERQTNIFQMNAKTGTSDE